MGISDITKHSRLIIRLYVIILFIGVIAGLFLNVGFDVGFYPGHAIYEIVWPLGGVMFGIAWFGAGPLIALFAIGIYAGGLIKSYIHSGGTLFIGGGTASFQLVESTMNMAIGFVEILAFLYGAVGGMYLALHYLEIYDYGMSIDESAKRNFFRKSAQGLVLAFVAMGLKISAI
ncbi:MAG: hypothetical protein V3R86_04545 [Candidatus Hydrothermarchaeaceae archaeon]